MKSIKRIEISKGGEMMRKLAICVLMAVLIMLAVTGIAYAGKTPGGTVNLGVGVPTKGMYCADPAQWIQSGHSIYVWNDATPIRAQVFDAGGYLQTPGITWSANGASGSMTLFDSTNKIYSASPTSMKTTVVGNNNYTVTYTSGGKTFTGVVRRWNSKCDGCHASPPAHAIANKGANGVSTCRNSGCHVEFALKMKTSHAARVPNNTTATACMSCHPPGCYTGVHAPFNIDCVSCHGSLADLAEGRGMWVPGSKGLPRCEQCHTSPTGINFPYSQNTGKLYKDSVAHGRKTRGARVACITCHNSMHMEESPLGKWGGTLQSSNNCSKCHTTQATATNMGPVCGNCHLSSTSPHVAKK